MAMVTIKDAAEQLGIAVNSVWWWINKHNVATEDKVVSYEKLVRRTKKVKHVDLEELRRKRGE